MTEVKKNCIAAFACTLVGISFVGLCHGTLMMLDYKTTGETRIYKQTFADERVEYTAEYELQNGFGVSNWVEIYTTGDALRCLQLKWSEDEPKRIIREYSEEKSLKCEQIKIDRWLAQRKAQEVVESEYIKYP